MLFLKQSKPFHKVSLPCWNQGHEESFANEVCTAELGSRNRVSWRAWKNIEEVAKKERLSPWPPIRVHCSSPAKVRLRDLDSWLRDAQREPTGRCSELHDSVRGGSGLPSCVDVRRLFLDLVAWTKSSNIRWVSNDVRFAGTSWRRAITDWVQGEDTRALLAPAWATPRSASNR